MPASFVYDAVRTPFARHAKAFADVRPDDLAATVMASVVERTGLDPARIEDVIFGDANQAGEDNRNVARFGALLAGFPSSVPGTTINRLCGSSLDAVIQGSRAIEAGDAEVILAGGVESMTRAPFVVEKSPRPFPAANQTMWNTSIGWRMTNPRCGRTGRSPTARAPRSSPRSTTSPARSRTNSPPAATASPRPRGPRGASTTRSCRSRATRSRATKASATTPPPRCWRACVRPYGRAGRSPRAIPRHQRRRLGGVLLGAEGGNGCEPLARIAGRARSAKTPPCRRRSRRGGEPRSRPRRQDVGRRVVRRAQRGVRVADPAVRRSVDRARPRVSTRTGERSRSVTPSGSGGRIIARAAHELKRAAGAYGRGDLHRCGAGLAVVLER